MKVPSNGHVSSPLSSTEYSADQITPSRALPQIDRSHADPQIVKAAEGMEALFLDYMVKVMRQTVPKNEMDLNSPAAQIYQGMMDSDFAEKTAHQGGIGLADQIIAYLSAQGYNRNQGKPIPPKEKP